MFSLALIDTVTELSLVAKKIYGQPLHFELVYPRHRSARLGLYSQILFNTPGDSRWEHGRKQWQDRVTERDTYLIYCVCGRTAGVFGFSGKWPFVAVVFHHFPPGTPSADTIWDAVNTFWCELYTNNTCEAVWTSCPLLLFHSICYRETLFV